MKKLTRDEYIKKVSEIHNHKYNYSKLIYNGYRSLITIICPIHGEFNQLANNHLINKSGCPECSKDEHKMTTEKYIEKVKKLYGNKYDYSLVDYKNEKTKIKIICPIHGIFEQRPYNHLNGHECPYCNESKGEKIISEILENKNIKYIPQKTFNGCKYKRKLKFDFYLPDYNLCIEYDGQQHFDNIKYYGGLNFLKITIEKDKIKDDYCKNNGISLLRIKYTDFNKIEEIIVNKLE